MIDLEKVDVQFHFQRRGKNKVLVEGKEPPKPVNPKGCLPRITRYMALAIYYESLIHEGHIHEYAEIATLGHVTRARVTQIMNLRLLAPDLQEQLLNVCRIELPSLARLSLCCLAKRNKVATICVPKFESETSQNIARVQ